MDEIKEVFFQIPPKDYGNKVQYMQHCFSLSDIKYISPVQSVQYINYFYFEVTFFDNTVKRFEFSTSSKALKAQRELARAYTRTGEFAYEPACTVQESSPESGTDVVC